MATKMIRQTMFNTGEVDIVTWKRTDVNEYMSSAQALLNAEVGTTGLAKKRKGTSLLFNATGYAIGNSHMYEFVDKFGNYYLLISVNAAFFVFSAPGDQVNVITNTGNQVVTNTGQNVVAFADNLTFLQAIPTPYLIGDLDNIDYTQDNDTLILTNPNYAPGRIYISAYNGSSPPTFAFQFLNIYPLPAYDFNTINYNNFNVTLGGTGTIGTTLTFTFTGLLTTDVVIALIGINNSSVAQVTVGSVSGGGLTWTKRASQAFLDGGNFQYIDFEIWWAPATSTLTSQAVTATFAASATSVGATIKVFAFSGANTSTPFDPVSTAFLLNTTTSTTTPQTTLTTTNANDVLFAAIFNGSGTPSSWTTQASFTTLGTVNGFAGSPNFTQAYEQGEYEVVSSTQTALTIGFTDASNTFVLFADAIKAAGAAATLPPQRASSGVGQ